MKVPKISYAEHFFTDVKTSPQLRMIKNLVGNYVVKGTTAALMERARVRQSIANAKSEYDRMRGDLSRGQGLSGDTVQMLQAREKELAMLMRITLPRN